MKTVCCILIAVALAHAAIDEYEVESVTSAPEVAAEDFYEAATPAEEGRHTFDDDESDFKPELAQEISKAGSNCPMERGFCVLSNGRDQNSGVRKLAGGDYNTASKKASCLNACRRIRGATGCEVIWHQGNRGCYAHTHSIARGNGVARHNCWVFSKCRRAKQSPVTCDPNKAKRQANAKLAKALKKAIKFEPNKTTLRKNSYGALNGVVKTLAQFPWLEVKIIGHSSAAMGSYCKMLTTGRAQTVIKYLQGKGVKNKMSPKGECGKMIAVEIVAAGGNAPVPHAAIAKCKKEIKDKEKKKKADEQAKKAAAKKEKAEKTKEKLKKKADEKAKKAAARKEKAEKTKEKNLKKKAKERASKYKPRLRYHICNEGYAGTDDDLWWYPSRYHWRKRFHLNYIGHNDNERGKWQYFTPTKATKWARITTSGGDRLCIDKMYYGSKRISVCGGSKKYLSTEWSDCRHPGVYYCGKSMKINLSSGTAC